MHIRSALNICSHLYVLYHKLSFAILNSHQLHRAALFTGERMICRGDQKHCFQLKLALRNWLLGRTNIRNVCVCVYIYIKYTHMYTHISLQKENRLIVSSPSYPWEVYSTTSRGCLKLQIQLNPIYAMLFPTYILFT